MKSTITGILASLHPEVDFENFSGNFIEDRILDSFDIVQIISELDTTFGISISGLDLIPENFSSVGSIQNLVLKYKNK